MNKKTIKSILIMGTASVIGYLMTLYLTSFITENIGVEAYGFVSIAKTFVNYGGIITVALTSFIVRYITICYHKNEIDEAISYYVSSINASVALCFLLTVLFSVIVVNLQHIINIPLYLITPVKKLFVAVFATFVLTTISTPFGTGFYIKNRIDLSGIIKIISYISEISVLIILFSIFDPSVWFVGIGSLVAAITILIGTYIANKKLVTNFKYDIRLHSNEKVKILLKNGLWNSINQLGNALNSGLDLLVSNAMLTGIQTGQIAIAKSIGIIFGTLSGIIFQPLQPELLKAYSQGINERFLNHLKKSMKLCGFFGSLAFSGFFALGYLFYSLWLPSQDHQLLHVLTLLTVFTYIMDIFLQPIYYISTLTVKNKIPCIITIIGGLLNVLGMFLLIKYTNIGIYSVPITTVVIMFSINVIFNPMYASWCLNIDKFYFYPLILRHLSATLIMCIAFKAITIIFNPTNWFELILNAILMTIIGVILYFLFTFDKYEKIEIYKKIKACLERKS